MLPGAEPTPNTCRQSNPWPERILPIRTDFPKTKWRGARGAFYSYQRWYDIQSGALKRTVLYDRRSDPQQRKDLVAVSPDVAKRYEAFVTAAYPPAAETASQKGLDEREEIQDRLKALGYLE